MSHLPATKSKLLALQNVSLALAGRQILRDITLELQRGEFLGVIGPNGGGKTSLLRVMLGLLRARAGEVWWGRDAGASPRLGYVPQRTGIDPSCPFSTREIIRQGAGGALPVFGVRRKNLFTKAEELIARVGLVDKADAPFIHLSGGQQRRTLLARALMDDPVALLLDEPTAGVDTQGQEQFCELLRDFSRQGIAVILVSHDIPLVTAYADRIACVCVNLHWHGVADALDHDVIRDAYRCELDRYQIHTHQHDYSAREKSSPRQA